MGYAKERSKLEKLSTKIVGINIYDQKNLAILIDIYEQYSHTVRILKNKEPETFADLYNNELQEVKTGKRSLKESESEETRQTNFLAFKESIQIALEKTIKATLASLK
ncbi:hypothetical protein CPT03_10115 [Pedobacter ginsengisoli]|uniref:Uncharacterized protein n=2 Tax=Pedobacter ginsengisoli TaxID=363852 RepID=A0A2D1UC60_9SPHI|nr:hypothetical protein CPT03_10115 [Pedobacter ginsengisoli]